MMSARMTLRSRPCVISEKEWDCCDVRELIKHRDNKIFSAIIVRPYRGIALANAVSYAFDAEVLQAAERNGVQAGQSSCVVIGIGSYLSARIRVKQDASTRLRKLS